ncbi:filamentous haemagglutinin family protein [Methylomicrobium album]|uniref:Filamentous hemagglutinin family N-terminal domain protein n=1 Tax=Methylomicrobium album BG8 TaxID=686340 RepID=H8GMN4_METAL|nr:filamentous haemagglutinin family protein [Methylomicrobium album]EIC28274.1 filamentous hemagglutinin family N-terminal domain protein [Methylomicrobium album BG8]
MNQDSAPRTHEHVFRLKPLVTAIRMLIAGGLAFGMDVPLVRAELPVPLNTGPLTQTPVDIATQGQATAQIAGNALNIKQITDKATLDWKSFNIDAGSRVRFDQPGATSIALNRIHDLSPSRIMGSLQANGQVYLVNQNGFVFGKDSQVNVNSLVATTLGISDETFQRGITKVFDIDNSAALQGSGEIYLKNDLGQYVRDQHGDKVKIQIFIENGAQIKTNGAGGRVIIAAPSVTNAGTIETPDGQTIIAAAQDKVYLQEAGSDSDIRGLLVEVNKGGEVDNLGKIMAERGNVSLMGFAVNQKGIASATTSVQLNGTVRLLAREGIQNPASTSGKLLPAATVRTADSGDGLGTRATVTLGKGSVTSVELDADKTATAIDAQAQPRSKIEISGHQVRLQSQSLVQAKSGNVSIQAVDNPANPAIKGSARIYLEKGSKVDVSGVKNVSLAMERNVVEVELRKNELRDSPLQRDGVLAGETVSVDLRDADLVYDAETGALTKASIPIADIKGAVDRIARNIDERSTSGGTIDLKSSGDIIAKQGSTLDFSGGSVSYRDGFISTTKLVSGSEIFDISEADPNRLYDAALFGDRIKYAPWAIRQRLPAASLTRHFEAGYVEGKAGGSLNISAYEARLDGTLNGTTIDGPYQRTPDQRTPGSTLNIDLSNDNLFGRQDIVFATAPVLSGLGEDDPLPRKAEGSAEAAALVLDPGLFKSGGIRNVDIKTNGSIRIDQGAQIEMADHAALTLESTGLEMFGSITSRSGEVTFKPIELSASGLLPSFITLGSRASIDVSGLWINDWLNVRNGKPLTSVPIDGGHVSLITEQGDLRLEQGSRIDVSGGAWFQTDGSLAEGKGGTIDLLAQTHQGGGKISNLLLDGSLSGWALHDGGRLNISTGAVVIGPAGAASQQSNSGVTPLVLQPGFFQQGGFGDYSVTSNYDGLTVADNVQVRPLQSNLQLKSDAYLKPSGASLKNVASAVTLPEYLRTPTGLTLSVRQSASQDRNAVLNVAKGAAIRADIGSTVTLNSDTSIFLDGTIEAPGGQIFLTLDVPTAGDSGFFASQGIWLGAESRLAARGVYRAELNPYNLRMGDVLPGGHVKLTANRGYIVAYAGSEIDVSGTTSTLDFREVQARGTDIKVVSKAIGSAGGTISLKAGEGILADGAFKAQGGKGAGGGTLAFELDGGLRQKPEFPIPGGGFPDDQAVSKPRTLEIAADSAASIPAELRPGDAVGAAYNGRALLSADRLNASGAASLSFKTDAAAGNQYTGSILFKGDVRLDAARSIVLDSPTLKTQDGQVTLNTAYAALGSTQSRLDTPLGDGSFVSRLAPEAVGGSGQFTVNAKGIDLVGGLSFNGFGNVKLASEGDVRAVGIRIRRDTKDFLGELKLAGDLTIAASQLYPATLTDYTINVSGGDRTVRIESSGGASAPVLSAGGSLTVNAPNIVQAGALKAPFGTLALNAEQTLELAPGSLTSVSGDGLTVPFGQVSGGMNWLYPLDTTGAINRLIDTPPEKRLTLTGQDIAMRDGAKVDLSGGGDLYAYEFIPGPGGSTDVLNPNSAGFTQQFAVIPGLGNALTPYDPLESPGAGLNVGDSVYLSGGSGLSAGWYTLLPAHYALLPGAYLVTPKAGFKDLQPGQVQQDFAGATIVAGRYGVPGAGIQDARWQGFAVEQGDIARTRSEFKDYSANTFFADKAAAEGAAAPQLPKDAGSLSIDVRNSLALGAELAAAPALNGLGGQVDISADRLRVVGSRDDVASSPAGTVSLFDDDLNALNAPSLLLGGVRSKEKGGQRVRVSTQTLNVAGDARLSGQEIVLAARDQLKLESGAVVESAGNTGKAGPDLLVDNKGAANSDGALLRVSSSPQVNVVRDKAVTGNTGTLTVEDGARLAAGGSMLLDSTRNTVFDGDIDMQGGSLALKSSRISLGEAPADTPGLVLSKTAFDLDELQLISATDLDIYGAVGIDAKRLQIGAAAINGFNNAGSTAEFSADSIRLFNDGSASQHNGTGAGSLVFNAREFELGSGAYAVDGFGQVTVNAAEAVKGAGQVLDPATGNSSLSAPGTWRVDGDLALNAGHFIGDAGATTAIDATGHRVSLASPAGAEGLASGGLGVRWSITADAIDSSGRFDLPSGILELNALTGNLDLNAGTSIDVSGRTVPFDTLTRFSPAGTVMLASALGNVALAGGAEIRLAGAASDGEQAGEQAGDAGLLDVRAARGQFFWNGLVSALGGELANAEQRAGSLRLDVKTFGDGGFSDLNAKLAAAGFAEEVSLRQRSGDVNIAAGDTVAARQFNLSADQGKVSLNGTLDVSGSQGGDVTIYGRNGIALGPSARIDASSSASGAEGGRVTLDTVHRDDAGSGLLDLAGGAIELAGGEGGPGGSLHLRTGRDADNTVNVAALHTAITGADPDRAVLEAARVYDGQTTITAANIASWKADTADFMAHAPSLQDFSGAGIALLPGLEIRGENLTLADTWDLIDWRYGGGNALPGFLTLRAGNDLNVNASLTDAFATDSIPGQTNRVYQDMLQAGKSWSYNLIAGNDVNLASSYLARNPLTPNSSTPVKTQVKVRTGTGSIAIDASHDIRFVSDPSDATAAAAVYTIGTTAKYTRDQLLNGEVPGVPARLAGESDADYLNRLDPALMDELLRFGYLDETRIGTLFQKAEFPTQGGDIQLRAGGDIDGVNTGQKMTDWLVRSGTLADNNTPTLWGINVSGDRSNQTGSTPAAKGIRNFNQNVGALGGGNVTVEAGGNIRNLSVMIPTTGKPLGTVGSAPNQWLKNGMAVNGGGDLAVTAGNDIVGGEFYTGLGTAALKAGGSVAANAAGKGAVFELGDARFAIQARQDINLGGVYNPTVTKQTQLVGGESRFFTYGAGSAVEFLSTAGNILFQNNAGTGFEYSVYPGTVKAAALSGDISINKSMTLFPSVQGQLELLAGRNVRSSAVAGETVAVNMSDADVSLLPDSLSPARSLEGSLKDGLIRAQERLDPFSPVANIIHAATPVHLNNGSKPAVVANLGDIAFAPGAQVIFFLPKASEFVAGRDIKNLSLSAQNLTSGDVTRIQAGRDIAFNTQISPDGVVLANPNKIEVGGPGQLQVLAGRNINLGSSAGIQTIGNIVNPALSQNGASINVLAGLSDAIDFDGFIERYQAQPEYRAALQALAGLGEGEQREHLDVFLKVLFEEIKQSAAAAAAAPTGERAKLYQRGFDAIKTLFPGDQYAGDLSLVFSQIKTLDGGGINLAAPGGKIDVGLAGQLAGIRKAANELGIVVQQEGDLNALIEKDFNVNQSRVFTLSGGDITVWSSKGSIDAGKGAKSAIAAPPPVTMVDEKGNIVTIFPPIVSGSGIQAIGDGQVTLAAPQGIVDAGEAGISGGRIVIAATAVVGASNIQASGGTVGVPTAPPAPVVPSGADSAAASAAKSATDSAENSGGQDDDEQKNGRKSVVSMISTDVVGYGNCSVNDIREGKPGCGI